uniref:Apple domain-containing protein n=1 Tax=Romanomermis culicivorax TaxID=13658 RepID=A0A915KIA8_ROMCU
KTLGDQTTISLPECLAACFKESSFGCQGVNYNIQNGLCELFDTKPSLSDNPDVDFYANNCAGGGTPGVVTTCNFDGMKVTVTRDQSFTGAVFAKMKYDTCRTEVKDSSSAMLQLGKNTVDRISFLESMIRYF